MPTKTVLRVFDTAISNTGIRKTFDQWIDTDTDEVFFAERGSDQKLIKIDSSAIVYKNNGIGMDIWKMVGYFTLDSSNKWEFTDGEGGLRYPAFNSNTNYLINAEYQMFMKYFASEA